MNRYYFFVLLFSFLIHPILWAKVIILDPGHGGEELGAQAKIGQKVYWEKDLALKLAFKIKEKLSPFASVYMTRSLDRNVSLKERALMVEKTKADYFISIHFNSSSDTHSGGSEIYYLDNSNDSAVKKVESQENLGLKGEDLEINQILIDLIIQQTVQHSKELAIKASEEVNPTLKIHQIKNRGTKRGLFYVLALSKVPGILLEVGFMSNQSELKKMIQETFLDQYANGIAHAIKKVLVTK